MPRAAKRRRTTKAKVYKPYKSKSANKKYKKTIRKSLSQLAKDKSRRRFFAWKNSQ